MRLNTKQFLLMGGTALIAGSANAADDWTRNFRIGMTLGLNIHADFKMGGQFNLASGNTAGPDYQFDDGYVKVDSTGNAGGFTSFWGYQNASQHATPDTLLFHSVDSFSTASSGVNRDDSPYIGFDMAYGGEITRWGRARVGWEFGVGILPI